MKFGADIYGPQRMKPNDFGDTLTSPLAPASQSFHLRCEISQHLLDGLPQTFSQTFIVPRQQVLQMKRRRKKENTVFPWPLETTHEEVF